MKAGSGGAGVERVTKVACMKSYVFQILSRSFGPAALSQPFVSSTVNSHVKGCRHGPGNQVPWVVDLVKLPAHCEVSLLAPGCALARA